MKDWNVLVGWVPVREKFSCDPIELVRLVLEVDGTQIDDDEYLRWLPDNTVFQLLRAGEKWQQQQRSSSHQINFQASCSEPSVTTPIPRVVCDALKLLEIRQEPPFWKIIDNRGRVTLVLHWDNGTNSSKIHYIEPYGRYHADAVNLGPAIGRTTAPSSSIIAPASVPRSALPSEQQKTHSVPVHSNENLITVVSDCDTVVTSLRGSRAETLANNVDQNASQLCSTNAVAGGSSTIGTKGKSSVRKHGQERSYSEAANYSLHTATASHILLSGDAQNQKSSTTTATTTGDASSTIHGHHYAGEECEFHCGSLHEERQPTRYSSFAMGAGPNPTTSKVPHVRFRETFDGCRETSKKESKDRGGTRHQHQKIRTDTNQSDHPTCQHREDHDSSESEDLEQEPSNTLDGDEQEHEGNVRTEKTLLLTDQLSTDQRKHLTILDLGVILDRLKAKIIDVQSLEREREGPSCFRWVIKATIRGDILRDLGVLYNGNYYSISEYPGSDMVGFDEDEEDREDPV